MGWSNLCSACDVTSVKKREKITSPPQPAGCDVLMQLSTQSNFISTNTICFDKSVDCS